MRIHRSFDAIPTTPPRALTIGTFDGVHRGHRAILEALRAEAERIGGESLIVTFDPHPQEVLRKTGAGVPILTPIDQKLELFAQLGVDAVAVIPFTLEFAATPWKEFVDTLIAQAGMAAMVVGHDHAFGKGREGNAASLRAYGEERGYAVTQVPPLLVDGEAISSTVIRRALAAGDVEGAAAKLGRPYTIRGTVVPGDGRGRSIGIPTANIAPGHPDQLIPHDGVYVVRLRIADDHGTFSAPIGGMANIGVRPTFTDGERRTIEAHLFDFSDELYNRTVDLECRTLLRFEQKFPSKEAFLEQLARDRAASETALDLIRAAETPPTDRLQSSE